jgi:hypothetical protein
MGNFWKLHNEIRAFTSKIENAIKLGEEEIAKIDGKIAPLQAQRQDTVAAVDYLSGLHKNLNGDASQ